LLTNILHHFDPAGCRRLCGGWRGMTWQAITLEFVPNKDRISRRFLQRLV
jgi:hypothetical protein